MAEYISREAAITAVKAHCPAKYETAVLVRIVCVPAADVAEVRHGRWCMLSYDEAVCTCCGYNRNTPFESTKEAKEKWNELPPFCEMCGAKMDESEDEE